MADEREPGRAGVVVSVGADLYRGAWLYEVQYPDAPTRHVPYRGGLVAAQDQDQDQGE
ncbi:hypothetical protein [Streptomyces buecherae]|uniref:hypothetical protein n=1 Tax=Streptomyces buecherae TaxID=2763006 RepID=UPI00164ED5CD|nr:hypothetical protein [Streptomyces buecherae]QNJ42011.1 hypothetical protein H7H31_21255 [Streptomyces buecherae]